MNLFPIRWRGYLAGARTFTPARGAGSKHSIAGRFPVHCACRDRSAGSWLPGTFGRAERQRMGNVSGKRVKTAMSAR
jgi:hypothetical protein